MKADHFAVNTIVLTLSRGLALGGRAIVLLILAWTATPGLLARSAIIVTLAETARLIGDLGVETWLIRRMGSAENAANAARAARTALWLRIAASAVGVTIILILARGIVLLNREAALTAAVLTTTGLIAGVPISVLQSRLQLPRLLFSQIPLLTIGLAVVIIAARHQTSAESTLVILAIFEFLAVATTLMQSDLLKASSPPIFFSEIVDAFRVCLPIALFNALVGVYSRMDVWFLAWLSTASLPSYTVAFRLYQPWGLLTSSIAGVAYASMARSMRPESRAGALMTRKNIFSGLLIACAFMLSMIGVGILAIDHFLPRYRSAILVLEILAPLVPLMGLNGLCTAVLWVQGKFLTLCELAGFNLILFAALFFFLVPPYGAAGAALALLIGETCNALIQSWLLRTPPASTA